MRAWISNFPHTRQIDQACSSRDIFQGTHHPAGLIPRLSTNHPIFTSVAAVSHEAQAKRFSPTHDKTHAFYDTDVARHQSMSRAWQDPTAHVATAQNFFHFLRWGCSRCSRSLTAFLTPYTVRIMQLVLHRSWDVITPGFSPQLSGVLVVRI